MWHRNKFLQRFSGIVFLILASWLSACGAMPEPTATPEVQQPTQTPTNLPDPTPTNEQVPQPTETPLPEPTEIPTAIPIGKENVNGLRAISRLGEGTLGQIAVSPDGSTLAVAGSQGLWLLDKFTFEILTHSNLHAGAVQQVTWSPDGKLLATSGADGTVRIWATLEFLTGSSPRLEQTALLVGHTDQVNALTWSPNGEKLASGGEDQSIRIWTSPNFKSAGVINHTSAVYALDWHPDSEKILIGEFDGSISISNGSTFENYTSFFAHEGWITSVKWSPDGNSVISGGLDRTLRTWNVQPDFTLEESLSIDTIYAINTAAWAEDGKKIFAAGGVPFQIDVFSTVSPAEDVIAPSPEHTYRGHTAAINSLAIGPGGVLFSTSEDNTLRAWRMADQEEIRRLAPGSETVFTSSLNAVDWAPDGQIAASGGADGKVRIWSTISGENLAMIDAHNGIINSLDWSAGGNWIATGASDNFTRIWNAQTGELVQEQRSEGGKVNAVAFSPIGNMIASGGFFRIIQVWTAGTDQAPLLLYPDIEITALSWASSGTILAVGGNDGTVRLYNPQTGSEIGLLSREQNTSIMALQWEPLGGRLAAIDRRGTIIIWESSSGEVLARHQGDGNIWTSLSWASQGVLAAGNELGSILLLDALDLAPLTTQAGHPQAVNALAFNHDGTSLATTGAEGSLVTWSIPLSEDLPIMQERPEMHRPGALPGVFWPPSERLQTQNADQASQLAVIGRGSLTVFDGSGKHIAAGGSNGVWIFNQDEPEPVLYLEGNRTFGLAWSPNGRYLASRELQLIRIWDVETAQTKIALPVGLGLRNALAWSPDSSLLAVADRRGEVRIYNMISGAIFQTWNTGDEVRDLAWSPDGRNLAAASGQYIEYWHVPAGKQEARLEDHSGAVQNIAFHPNASLLLSVGEDLVIRIWDLSTIVSASIPLEGEAINWPGVQNDSIDITEIGPAEMIAWSGEGDIFLTSHTSGSVVEWGTATRQTQNTIIAEEGAAWALMDNGLTYSRPSAEDGHYSALNSVQWLSDDTLLTIDADNTLRIETLPEVQPGKTPTAINSIGPVIDLVPGGPHITFRQVDDNSSYRLIHYDPSTEQWSEIPTPIGMFLPSPGELVAAASPDGRFVVWNNPLSDPQSVDILDLDTGENRALMSANIADELSGNYYTAFSWSADQKRVAGASFDGRLSIWNVDTGNRTLEISLFEQQITDLEWSPDGNQIAAAGSDGGLNDGFQFIRLVQAATGRIVNEFQTDFARTTQVLRYSEDGLLLAAGDSAGSVQLWNIQTGERLADLSGHKLSVTGLAFSPGGTALASSSRDGTVRIWGIEQR